MFQNCGVKNTTSADINHDASEKLQRVGNIPLRVCLKWMTECNGQRLMGLSRSQRCSHVSSHWTIHNKQSRPKTTRGPSHVLRATVLANIWSSVRESGHTEGRKDVNYGSQHAFHQQANHRAAHSLTWHFTDWSEVKDEVQASLTVCKLMRKMKYLSLGFSFLMSSGVSRWFQVPSSQHGVHLVTHGSINRWWNQAC